MRGKNNISHDVKYLSDSTQYLRHGYVGKRLFNILHIPCIAEYDISRPLFFFFFLGGERSRNLTHSRVKTGMELKLAYHRSVDESTATFD